MSKVTKSSVLPYGGLVLTPMQKAVLEPVLVPRGWRFELYSSTAQTYYLAAPKNKNGAQQATQQTVGLNEVVVRAPGLMFVVELANRVGRTAAVKIIENHSPTATKK